MPAVRARLLAALGGVAVAVVLGDWFGACAGIVTAAVLAVALPRVEPPQLRRERIRAAADLPIAADLLAATLRTGAPPDRAAGCVGEALGGPVGVRLVRVARALRVGVPPEQAWAALADLAGTERLVRAAVRSADRGTALAPALDRLADELRAQRETTAEAAARRVGVLAVLPLGMCFLPAFLLAGVVPVVIAVLGDVLTY
ncbi:MAG TPA: type II secretion system F family protein [Micromonosporaceae bacterium]|nr:type II secretion system F family protein [Micromonosporaceae bacterium]